MENPDIQDSRRRPQELGLKLETVEDSEDSEESGPGTTRLATPPRTSDWKKLMVGIGIGAAIAVGGMQLLNNRPQEETAANSSGVAAEAPNAQPVANQTVTVAIAESARVERSLDATGTVQAYDLLPVLPQASGLQIKQVLVDEGDVVEAGQVLAILDDAVERSQITEAEAQIDSARSTVADRQAAIAIAEAAVSQALATQSEAEAAVATAEAAKAEVEAGAGQVTAGIDEAQSEVDQAVAAKAEAEAALEQTRASLAQAQAELAQAERERDRYQQLAEAGAVSTQELETRSTAAENARERVRVAEANIRSAQARITSSEANIASMRSRVVSANSNREIANARVKSAESNVSSAQARLQSAIANVQIARSQLDSARANANSSAASLRSTQARAQQVETQQERTVVRAPKAGIIAERVARVGDVTSNTKQLFSIIANGQLELQVKIPETQLSQIKIGAPVEVTSDADSRIKVAGTVREIAPLVDEESRQATVKVSLPSDSILRPGMFLRAGITTSAAQAITIPGKAVLPQANGSAIVYRLVGEDMVQAQPVEMGEVASGSPSDLSSTRVEIKSGLSLGDRVVVEGAAYLKDGDRIRIGEDFTPTPQVEL
ncbi:efflux RND transporter periplasmic adaptor subunit [Laspinema sp. D1]|uniref:Efflux RND transporter periplasmic adaptor subunit n=1 Tax=Laspinema palackyanum D2a TaxID=2953684 RepID=A0ABT2MMV7_9CYAN|nr:efflux RND transporter periplasmic adaptor subunit [Laspinema sp. D2a]